MGILVGAVFGSLVLGIFSVVFNYFSEDIKNASSGLSKSTRQLLMTITMVIVLGPPLFVFFWCAATIK